MYVKVTPTRKQEELGKKGVPMPQQGMRIMGPLTLQQVQKLKERSQLTPEEKEMLKDRNRCRRQQGKYSKKNRMLAKANCEKLNIHSHSNQSHNVPKDEENSSKEMRVQ